MDKTVATGGDTIITDRFILNRNADELRPEDVAKLTVKKVIENLRKLKPFFLENAASTEKRGRPSDEVWRAVLKTGYMHLAVPKRFGGLEATMEEILDATAPMSEADPSLGWVACFNIMTPRGIAGYPIEVQEKLLQGKSPVLTNLVSPTGHAKKVKGGYIVTGRWAWCTTIQFAEWVNMFAQVEMEDGSMGPHYMFLAPASETRIVKTWDAHGMIGTGTHHVVGDGIFVPDDMVAKSNNSEPAWFEQIEKYHNYPLFLSAPWPSSGLCVVGPVVQAARGAVEAARDHLLHYTKRSSPDEERLKMSAQLRLGEAASLAKAAELLTREVARVNWEELNWKDHEDDPRYHEVRGWMAEAVDLARKVVQILAQAGGTSIHYYSHRLGRHYRDVITGSSHVVCDFDDLTSGYGKSMLGLETRKRAHWKDINKVRNELAASRGLDYSKTDEESVKVMPTI